MTPEHLLGKFPSFDPVARHLTPFQGVLTEGFFGFVLIFVALSCHDTENRPPAVMPSLAIASCIAIGLIAAVRMLVYIVFEYGLTGGPTICRSSNRFELVVISEKSIRHKLLCSIEI
jgi:glycerol uptake facilitator-like aquaporin